ncbi:hypothetical protein HBI22_095100 [Parastagonospora nodorum]|nr:hypothetical protein HBI28_080450 [Parastagonospora nodorum]KAH5634388.1 hypothetical protein HBI22_095100 [Parastagonospora nodorum]
MSAIHESDRRSRSSSRTRIQDLEMGEARPEKEEEVVEEMPKQADQDTGADLEKHLSRKSTRKDQLAPEKYPLTDLDNNLIGWDSQDDPTNPRNFPDRRKWTILGMVAAITFLSPLASSIFAPGIPFVNADFNNTSQILGSFAVSVYVLGFAIGPLILSPLSGSMGDA